MKTPESHICLTFDSKNDINNTYRIKSLHFMKFMV